MSPKDMNLVSYSIPIIKPNPYTNKSTSKVVLLITTLFFITIIPLYCYYYQQEQHGPLITPSQKSSRVSPDECDLSKGEWVPDPHAPYYTNQTCSTIHEHQNCMKYGRPDTGFMRWRWKPNDCELPLFDPQLFLDHVRGKSMVFVGDSLARNHMQSLLCLLTKVSHPIVKSKDEHFGRYYYPSYNLTIANIWSPYLVKADSTGPIEELDGAYHLHLDKPDVEWTARIASFDYVIISAGQWFFRPSYFYELGQLVGCYRCHNDTIKVIDMHFGYKRAFRSAFTYLNGLANYTGMTFLRTYSPSHFESGEWNKGGDCRRTSPARSNETRLEDYVFSLYMTSVEELRVAKRDGEEKGLKYHLLDITNAMQLRADGHPRKYGYLANAFASPYKDCVHWCLPGPIDSWSALMLEILKREQKEAEVGQKGEKRGSDNRQEGRGKGRED